VQAVNPMVLFRLDPEKFLLVGEAWERARSQLGNSAELARRIDELSQQDDDLGGPSKKLNRQGHDLGDRVTDNRSTDEEREAAGAELDTVVAELVAELAVARAKREGINTESQDLFERYDAEERRIERLMRDALADGLLATWIEGPDGQPRPLLDRESWRPAAAGFADIASIPDSQSPGPDTGGKPAFVEKLVFENWLNAQPRETGEPGGEPAAVASAAESPSEPTRWQRDRVIVALKRLLPPDGLRPKGRSVQWVTDKLNELSEFKDNKVSPDTVDRALKEIEASPKK
jgi:hypothetical protein